MSNGYIDDFIYAIRRWYVYRSLLRWKRKTGLLEKAYGNINTEHRNAAKQLYIRRRIDGADIFVDIYWHIKKSENTPHFETIYYRCNWLSAKRVIDRVEKIELPERINLFFEDKQ